MEKKKYDELLLDKSVIKFGEWNGAFFSNKENELSFYFYFCHSGVPNQVHNERQIRVGLDFPLNPNLGDLPLIEISDETLVLVNYENENFAFTFKIAIDKTNKKLLIKINDMPELGAAIMTDEETNGIGFSF